MELAELPPAVVYMLAIWFGAVLTSFGRLAVCRLPHQLGWRDDANPRLKLWSPSSHCDHCGQPIKWQYLIPVIGWCFARGRCSTCALPVSFLHPILELIGGLGWGLWLVWFGLTFEGLAACLLWQVLLFLAEIDWLEQWLPVVVTVPLFWGGLLYSPFSPDIADRAWGGFVGFVIMWFSMVIASKWRKIDAFSGGDIALSTVAGVWLGFGRLPYFLLIASLIFIIIAWPARCRGQLFVPMGPALALAMLICLLLPPLY